MIDRIVARAFGRFHDLRINFEGGLGDIDLLLAPRQANQPVWKSVRADIGLQALGRITLRVYTCLLYTSPSPRDQRGSRMPSSA